MTHRSLYHQKPTPAWVTAHEIWKPVAYKQLDRLGCPFQVVQTASLASAFSRLHLCYIASLSLSLSNHSLLIYAWEGRGLVYLVSFRNFLNPLSCLLPELKEPLSRMDCSAHPQYSLLFHLLCNIVSHNFPPRKVSILEEADTQETQFPCFMGSTQLLSWLLEFINLFMISISGSKPKIL